MMEKPRLPGWMSLEVTRRKQPEKKVVPKYSPQAHGLVVNVLKGRPGLAVKGLADSIHEISRKPLQCLCVVFFLSREKIMPNPTTISPRST